MRHLKLPPERKARQAGTPYSLRPVTESRVRALQASADLQPQPQSQDRKPTPEVAAASAISDNTTEPPFVDFQLDEDAQRAADEIIGECDFNTAFPVLEDPLDLEPTTQTDLATQGDHTPGGSHSTHAPTSAESASIPFYHLMPATSAATSGIRVPPLTTPAKPPTPSTSKASQPSQGRKHHSLTFKPCRTIVHTSQPALRITREAVDQRPDIYRVKLSLIQLGFNTRSAYLLLSANQITLSRFCFGPYVMIFDPQNDSVIITNEKQCYKIPDASHPEKYPAV